MTSTATVDDKLGGRQLKKTVLSLLSMDAFEDALPRIVELPPKKSINPILGLLCADDERVRWRAVAAAGAVVARLASEDREAAREIVRRLMWGLNMESGGVGWGAPEAMAEIMAQEKGLAQEYAGMLVSYLDPRGNFLEHELLQRGLLWGIARLATVAPDLVKDAASHLREFMNSRDAAVRGLAAMAAGAVQAGDLDENLNSLVNDDAQIKVHDGKQIVVRSVGELATEALRKRADRKCA